MAIVQTINQIKYSYSMGADKCEHMVDYCEALIINYETKSDEDLNPQGIEDIQKTIFYQELIYIKASMEQM
jgi:hypothetical protein